MYHPEFKKLKSYKDFTSYFVNNSESEINLKEKYKYLIK